MESLRRAFSGRGLGAPLGRAAVRAFEAEHGIAVPEPYRTFTALVGDGCAEGPPAYGLARLADTVPEGWRPGVPFPLTEALLWDDAEDLESGEPDVRSGCLLLGTDGCAMDWVLVVAGEQLGHVWLVTDVGALPFGRPFGHTGGTPGFDGWAAHWAAGRDWFDRRA